MASYGVGRKNGKSHLVSDLAMKYRLDIPRTAQLGHTKGNPMTTCKPRLTAGPAYENSLIVSGDLVERIRELLFSMPAPSDATNWSHVAELVEVNSQLCRVIAFLDGIAG